MKIGRSSKSFCDVLCVCVCACDDSSGLQKANTWATELAGTGGGGVQGGHHTRKVLRCKKRDNPSMHLFLICYTCNAGHVLPSRQSLIFHTGSDACIWRKQLLWPASKAGRLAPLGRRYVRKRNPKLTLQLVG